MPPAATKAASPVMLVCGEDEFAVRQRAKQLFAAWSEELGGMDHETIEASVNNSDEADKAINRLREALNTLPFFGSGKVVWLRDCNFLGDERTAQSALVTERLADLSQELKEFQWQGVRLLVSAGKVDKRKTFCKTLEKIGKIESFEAWSVNDKDWAGRAGMAVAKAVEARGKQISDAALAEMVSRIGPHPRQLESEVEKVSLFIGARPQIEVQDVKAVCTRNKSARAFAVGDALGERNLPALLRCLDEELWEMQFDKEKSEIRLLYGLISKVRVMLMLKEMVREGWVGADADYQRFQKQIEKIPADKFPAEKKFNPLAMHPFMLHRALEHSAKYSSAELVRAMDLLLQCNQRLVTSALDESLVLQQALVQIVGAPQRAARAA